MPEAMLLLGRMLVLLRLPQGMAKKLVRWSQKELDQLVEDHSHSCRDGPRVVDECLVPPHPIFPYSDLPVKNEKKVKDETNEKKRS